MFNKNRVEEKCVRMIDDRSAKENQGSIGELILLMGLVDLKHITIQGTIFRGYFIGAILRVPLHS